MATLYRKDLEGNRVVEKGPNFQGLEEMGSIPAQPPDDGQVMLNKSFHSCGAWPSDPTSTVIQPCLWGFWE